MKNASISQPVCSQHCYPAHVHCGLCCYRYINQNIFPRLITKIHWKCRTNIDCDLAGLGYGLLLAQTPAGPFLDALMYFDVHLSPQV